MPFPKKKRGRQSDAKKKKKKSNFRAVRELRHAKTGAGARVVGVGPFGLVWNLVKRIPRGRVATYGQLSEMIERRLTPVGIGWAIRAAAEDAIPWHRVVNSQGGISTDREHPGLQRAILETEGVVFDENGLIDLARAGWRPSVRHRRA